jgi:hypothetical protein
VKKPLVLYIPGLLPKPEAGIHKDALRRCLLAGVERIDTRVADELRKDESCFDVVAWTYDFYREHREFSLDARSVEALIEQVETTEDDIVEASALAKRVMRWVYRTGDLFPFLIPHLVTERVEIHLRDLRRYIRNENGIGDHTREMLKLPMRAASELGRPILLLAHSMGSVIAYESLWEMSHDGRDDLVLDMLVTMGSPLGQTYVQRRMLGYGSSGAERYPNNVRRWVNLAAVGDMTAVDPVLADDFRGMLNLGLIESIEDIEIFNAFRLDGALNEHAEYGYLINRITAEIVVRWWREQRD